MAKKYYIKFLPEAKINYFHLFGLIDVAEYRAETKAFDFIKYQSLKKLSEEIGISQSTINRMFQSAEYLPFFNVNKKEKTITIFNSVINGSNNNRFVCLDEKEVQFLRKNNDNLLAKYYIYIKYWCGRSVRSQNVQDFTAKQFLSSCGYSTNSNSYIDNISRYNKLLVEGGFVKIKKYIDELGHTRNTYLLA